VHFIQRLRIVKEMVDPHLFSCLPFMIFAVSNFLTSFGMNPPLLFIDAYAQDVHHIPKEDSFFALQAFGRLSLSP